MADARLLWRGLRVMSANQKHLIEIVVEGEAAGRPWTCGLEFDYANAESKKDLKAVAIFDRIERGMPDGYPIPFKMWRRREIESYFTSRDVLMRYAAGMEPEDLVGTALRRQREEAMRAAIDQVEGNLVGLDKAPWSHDFKVSDEFLPIVFKRFFQRLGTDDRMNKSDFHVLVDFVLPAEVDPEVVEVLDLIVTESDKASRP